MNKKNILIIPLFLCSVILNSNNLQGEYQQHPDEVAENQSTTNSYDRKNTILRSLLVGLIIGGISTARMFQTKEARIVRIEQAAIEYDLCSIKSKILDTEFGKKDISHGGSLGQGLFRDIQFTEYNKTLAAVRKLKKVTGVKTLSDDPQSTLFKENIPPRTPPKDAELIGKAHLKKLGRLQQARKECGVVVGFIATIIYGAGEFVWHRLLSQNSYTEEQESISP